MKDITQEPGMDKLHHSDVVTQALERFEEDCNGPDRQGILDKFRGDNPSLKTPW